MSRDYNNLQYILNKTPDELLVWWTSLEDEDKAYAIEIITEYRKILNEPIVADCSIAKHYLKKFQL